MFVRISKHLSMFVRISQARHFECPLFQLLFNEWHWLPRNPYWSRTHHLGWVTIVFPGSRWREDNT